MDRRRTCMTAVAAFVVSATALAASSDHEAVQAAHDRYLAAINAHDLGMVLDAVTDDIVLVAPNAPAMVGKAEMGPWVQGYFEAVHTSWHKTPVEVVIADSWAFERYTFLAVDRAHEGGVPRVETGNGLNIYRKEADGVWRVARDVWATDGVDRLASGATCTGGARPC